MDYTFAKLHIPKKGNDWYVYWTFRNPITGQMKLFKVRGDINRIVDLKKRKREGLDLEIEINTDLKSGWSPFLIPKQADEEKLNFYYWVDLAIEKSESENSFYHTSATKVIKNKLLSFRKKIMVADIDEKFLMDLKKFLVKKGNSQNTIADNFTRISIIVKKIVKDGLIPYHKNPFFDYKIAKTKTIKKRTTESGIEKLAAVDLSKNKSEELARDMYIFSFYFAGIRFGDVIRMENRFITDKLRYTMHKKKNERALPIVHQVETIIKKYKSKDKYLFPTKFDELKPDKSIKYLNYFYNQKLKSACKKAELPELTFHTSRHSFADLAYKKGADDITMRDLLGHENFTTTQIYRKNFYEEQSEVAMNKIFKK